MPVALGRAMAAQLGVPGLSRAFPEIVGSNQNSGRQRLPPSATNFATLDQPGVKVAAVNDTTTTMRGAIAHLKHAKVTGYQTCDEIFALLKSGEVDAFALSRGQLNAMAKKIPGTRVLDETFKQTVTAVAVGRLQGLIASKVLQRAVMKSILLITARFDRRLICSGRIAATEYACVRWIPTFSLDSVLTFARQMAISVRNSSRTAAGLTRDHCKLWWQWDSPISCRTAGEEKRFAETESQLPRALTTIGGLGSTIRLRTGRQRSPPNCSLPAWSAWNGRS